MTDVDLRITGRVESLHLEPGDRILVTLDDPNHFPHERVKEVREAIEENFPGHEVVILGGVRLAREAA